MPLILHIETATEVCSIGLSDNGIILALEESSEPYQHASEVTLLIENCIRKANVTLSALDAVAVSTGPGSYTALRVGASTAKGICYALDKPLIAVDTLMSLARASSEEMAEENVLLCPMIDARRMEVYTRLYDHRMNEVRALQSLIVEKDSFDEFFAMGKHILFSGNGAPKCKEVLQQPQAHFSRIVCSAQHLIALAEEHYQAQSFVDIANHTPNYFKAPNITTPRKFL